MRATPDAVEGQDGQQLELVAGAAARGATRARAACPTKTTRVSGSRAPQLVGHGDAGEEVAAGAARRDEDRARHGSVRMLGDVQDEADAQQGEEAATSRRR